MRKPSSLSGSTFYVEFHNSQHSGYIHHCLLRVYDNSGAQALTKDLTTLGDTFVHFSHLETVVLETSHELKPDDVESSTKRLRDVCRPEVVVQHRTCDDGHKLALEAKESASRSTNAGLLSPFWCLRESVKDWDKW